MKGKWATGIPPRNFTWVVEDHLAMSERPGGFAPNHRRVRRQEEIIWLRGQGFTRVVSLLGSPHNLAAYEEGQLPSAHFALPASGDVREILVRLFAELERWISSGEKVLVHQEELGERVMGVVAAYLMWSGRLPDAAQAIAAVERLGARRMGLHGRELVAQMEPLARRSQPTHSAAQRPPASGSGLSRPAAPATGVPGTRARDTGVPATGVPGARARGRGARPGEGE
ncbi:MAG: hypothetical protein ACYCUF_12190 [Acidimicrobiales bacterium]|nr:hypothetical protein [Actinomycetota bacterium]